MVVGGSLGSYAAERLSALGWRVVLYEKNPKRHVVCGGLVNTKTVEMFPFLKEYAVHAVDGAIITAGDAEIEVRRKKVAYVLDRDLMFRDMLERAQAAGTETIYRTWKGETRQRLLLGADGALSEIRKRVIKYQPRFVLGYQTTVRWKEEDVVRVDFGPWAPGFFGWVIPLGDGMARVGIGLKKYTGKAPSLLKKYLDFLGVEGGQGEGRIIPVSLPLPRVARGDTLLVGDAGVFTKASTGGDISFGLRAIESFVPLLDAYLTEEAPLERINGVYRREFYPKLFVHWLIHRAYNTFGAEKILRAARETGLDSYLSKRGDMEEVGWLVGERPLRAIFRTFFPFSRTPR